MPKSRKGRQELNSTTAYECIYNKNHRLVQIQNI